MLSKVINVIKGSRLGQACDNLLKQTMGDGFKSKCVVASYFTIIRASLLAYIILLIAIIVCSIEIMTGDTPFDTIIQILQIGKDLYSLTITFFGIALATTFGASAFGIQTPNTKIITDSNVSEGEQ